MNETSRHNRNNRVLWCILAVFFTLGSSPVLADAADGEYLGFRLGDKISAPRGTEVRVHITGAQIFDLDPGTHDHHVDAVSIYVSPKSSTVGSIFGEWYFANERAAERFAEGYLANLEGKYGRWKRSGRSLTYKDFQLWVELEKKPVVTERWISTNNFRVSIGLIYAPETLGRSTWMATVNLEANNPELAADH